MQPRKFALIGGIVMLAMGLLALIPDLYAYRQNSELPTLVVQSSYGYFLGFIPMNILNKLTLVLFGIAGIAATRAPTTSLPKSITWSRWVFFVMAPLAVLGLFYQTNTLGGYMPLFEAQAWIYGIFAILGAYFGFALTTKAAQKVAPLKEGKNNIRAA
jgi:hypothetical protein